MAGYNTIFKIWSLRKTENNTFLIIERKIMPRNFGHLKINIIGE